MSSLQYLSGGFISELTSFLLSFVLWSFQVLSKDSMEYGIRSGKIQSLGMPKAPQGKIQGHQKAKAWGCLGRHPLFRLLPSVTYLELYFYSPHDMCFAWSVLYYLSLYLLVCHNHLCCAHLLMRDTHDSELIRILYVLHLYLLSYIVFALVLHLYLL